MASERARISDRIRIDLSWRSGPPDAQTYPSRPRGVNSGTWMNLLGLIWLRLGRRSSWEAEDLDAKMIQPVEPGS